MLSMKGFLAALVTSSTFGLLPLFTLPVMADGMNLIAILFYRFLFSAVLLMLCLFLLRCDLRITRAEGWTLAGLSLFYDGCAAFLFWAYHYLPSGVAATINFLYPVIVTVIMIVWFHEKKSFWTFCALALAFCGVASLSLSKGGNGQSISLLGVGLDLISALSYALYIVWVNHSCVRKMPMLKLNFYVFLFAAVGMGLLSVATGQLQAVPDVKSYANLTLMALVCTVVSNITLVYAIQHLGSTLTSVLGAMESVTAVLVGVWVFGEAFTPVLALGILLIILSVTVVVLSPHLTPIFRFFKYYYLTEMRGKHRTLRAPR